MPDVAPDHEEVPDEVRIRAAIKRLRDGEPEDARNRDLVAKSIRLHGHVRINMRMVCREASYSPTTVYKRFPWVQDVISESGQPEAPSVVAPAVSDVETIAQQRDEIARLRKTVAYLQAENHQLAQANIALEERNQGAEMARQAAIEAGRRRKPDLPGNVRPINS